MFRRSRLSLPIREFKRCHNGGGSENVKKAIGWIGKTTILHVQHAFLYTSLPSRHHYDLKMLNFTWTSEDEIFSLCKLRLTGRNSAPEWFGCIWQSKRIGIIAMEIERTHWFALQATFSWPSPSWYLKVGTDVPRGTVKQRRGWHERNLAGILRLSHSSS